MSFENSKAYSKLEQELKPVSDSVKRALQPIMEEILKSRVRDVVFAELKNPSFVINRVVSLNEQYFENIIFAEFGDPSDQYSRPMLRQLMGNALGEYKAMIKAECQRSYGDHPRLLEEEGWQRRPASSAE